MTDTRAMTVLIAGLAVALGGPLAGPASADGRRAEAPLERAQGAFDHTAFAREQRAVHEALTAAQVSVGLDHPLSISLTDGELERLAARNSQERRLEVGITKSVGAVVDFSDLTSGRIAKGAQRRAVGAVRGTGAGGYVWTAAIESAEASALRLHLSEVSLPDGAELYLYNPTGQVRGPYTGRGPSGTGDFWTHTISGSVVLVQLHVTPGTRAGANGAATFDIDEVGHLGPKFPFGTTPTTEAGSNLCSFNEPCVQNASCSSIPAAIQVARDAVAMIEFRSGAFIYICSGGLTADTDPNTQIPYFITANHCLSRENEADSLEAFFQFSTPCGGACFDPDGVVPSTLGADIMATDKATDYNLLRLNEAAPAGSAFLGWTSTPVAFTNGVSLFRVSHPAGAPQAFSRQVVDTSRPTCRSWPRGNRIYSSDTFGGTEGGSSGSPVLIGTGQIVGQLSGACGFNVGDPCDAVENATVDGAFAAYYSQVASILDPAGGPTTTTLASTTTTLATTTTTLAPSTTTSTTLPGSCAVSGDSCVTATDCCSGTCRGRPGTRTCK